MSATSGRRSKISSRSRNLQQSLENKLRPLLTGSPECEVIWKPWITPWGQSLSKPRAVVRRNIEIDFGLWPTTTVCGQHNRKGCSATSGNGLSTEVKLVLGLWPTAQSHDGTVRGNTLADYHHRPHDLPNAVNFALWPTSTTRDWKGSKASPKTMNHNSRPCNEVVFSVWSTLRSTDGAKGGPNQSFGAGGLPLPSQVHQVAQSNSSNAQTENSVGSLHPEFAGWEMGYPPEWLNCAPLVTPSSRKSRQRS